MPTMRRIRLSMAEGEAAGRDDWAAAAERGPIAGRARPRPFAALARWLRSWREREQERRELATMSPRDFGDLQVPPSMVRDELRRWPWQKPRLADLRENANEWAEEPGDCGP